MDNQLKYSSLFVIPSTNESIFQCHFLADVKNARMISIGKEIEDLTGYPHCLFQTVTAKFIKKIFPSNDLKKLTTSRKLLMYYGKKDNKNEQKFSITEEVNLKHSQGYLIRVKLEVNVLQYDKNNFPVNVIGRIALLDQPKLLRSNDCIDQDQNSMPFKIA